MFELCVDSSFSAGHALRGYQGKCESPHGHNYKVRVTLAGDTLNDIGLLVDFKDLKSAMNQATDQLDHQFLNEIEPFQKENPSAENIARHLYRSIKTRLTTEAGGSIRIKKVKVWETASCAATYFE
jgi:6-pyruvoyltetrahydropterin/6-carboxytetrahydropterin synthase